MLLLLSRGDQRGIQYVRILHILDDPLSLLDQPGHPLALLSPRAPVETREDLLEALDLPARLLEVLLEGAPQLLARRLLGQLLQPLHHLLFGAVEVLQLVDQQVLQGFDLHFSYLHAWSGIPSARPIIGRRVQVHEPFQPQAFGTRT